MALLVEGERGLSPISGTDGALMSTIGGTGLVVVGRAVRLGSRGSGLRHVLEVRKNGGSG
jgi:hypothetical protein